MRFKTIVQEEDCVCNVTWYSAERPMVITGSGFGDAEPPEPEEFEYSLETLPFVENTELMSRQSLADQVRLLVEYKQHKAMILGK